MPIVCGFSVTSLAYSLVLCALSSLAVILLGKREMGVLLQLASCFFFLTVALADLQSVIVFPDFLRHYILSATSHFNCIVARCLINIAYLTECAFIRS